MCFIDPSTVDHHEHGRFYFQIFHQGLTEDQMCFIDPSTVAHHEHGSHLPPGLTEGRIRSIDPSELAHPEHGRYYFHIFHTGD